MLRSVCPNGSQKNMHLSFTSKKTNFTGILHMYPLYIRPEVPCNMLSYLFSCWEAITTLPVPLFRLLPVYSGVQSVHIPESPAEIQYHRFWTLITFFWLENSQLIYMYTSFCKVCSKTAQPQKVIFSWTSSTLTWNKSSTRPDANIYTGIVTVNTMPTFISVYSIPIQYQ